MQIFPLLGVILVGYILGSIPFGYMLVRLTTGQDIREIHSGRSGGTNAMRAAGAWVGILTGILDGLKAYFAVQIAMSLLPGDALGAALAPAAAVLGHNYSMFLVQRNKQGKLVLGGGAGGAPVVGGATGIWLPSLYLMLPIGLFIYYFVGYASVTTLSAGVMGVLIFGVGALLGYFPIEYIIFGIIALLLLIWALRPNLKRLREGTERLHGFRARKNNQ
ncbi:MAG: glycerol-3-phosphate acyltransferase [Chloroflexi bacterium]|nr:glycerol-3-phosphate acyltransferase [Chloroflexota bacterium]